ncbi:MAG: DUF6798 domain-containing protein [Planctomycetota bacterium]
MLDQLYEQQPASTRRWLEIALIFAVFFVAGGAPVPHVNETHYLAKAKQYWQPDWCEGDLFLESGKAHLTFYWTVGVLTKWLALPVVAWIGRVAAWLSLSFAWQRLCRTIAPPPFYSVIAAMVLVALIDWTNFAGEWVIGGVEGKCFAYAFVFLGLSYLAEGRWRSVWPCLGLASAFHVLVGGWSVVAAGMVWLCESREMRPKLVSMIPSLLLGGALSMLGVAPALMLTGENSAAVVSEANQIYVFDRLPHHLSPLTMAGRELGRKALRFGALLFGFACLRYVCGRQPARADEVQRSGRALDLLMRFALAALLISVIGLAWELAFWDQPDTAAKFLKYYVFRLADIAVPLATAAGVVWLAGQLIERKSSVGVLLLLAAAVLPSAHLLQLSRQRYEQPVPPAERKLRDPVAFRAACQWVREKTGEDALFLVPRMSQSFKWHTGRSDLVTWKDVPQSAAALLTWRDRLFDVHYYIDKFGERAAYGSLAVQGTERIRGLAEKYELDYVLTRQSPQLGLPIVYANESYIIYRTSDVQNHRARGNPE